MLCVFVMRFVLLTTPLHILIHVCHIDQLCRIVKERKALEQKMANKKCRQRSKIPASGTSLKISTTQTHTHRIFAVTLSDSNSSMSFYV